MLSEGGCSAVTVVLGAEADHAATLLEHIHDIRIVIASDWVKGMRASQSGARRRTGDDASGVLVHWWTYRTSLPR